MKLYVGNLPYQVTEDQLRTLFAEAGEVLSVKIMTDRITGEPRGFGFIEMATKAEGQRAISMINGRNVEGRTLKVNEARAPEKRGFGPGRGRR